jgi:hypothetical protein
MKDGTIDVSPAFQTVEMKSRTIFDESLAILILQTRDRRPSCETLDNERRVLLRSLPPVSRCEQPVTCTSVTGVGIGLEPFSSPFGFARPCREDKLRRGIDPIARQAIGSMNPPPRKALQTRPGWGEG